MKKYIQKITGILSALVLTVSFLQAQNELDALRYSWNSPVGTARSLGLAGAFSAVGADFSAAYLNPAGLGLYRRSEVSFSTNLRVVNNNSTYLDQTNGNSRARVGISNFGYVYSNHGEDDNGGALKSFSFSLGLNQPANYTRSTRVQAYNPESSITDFFAGQAQGFSFNQMVDNVNAGLSNGQYLDYANLAFEAFLIDTSGTDGNWVPAALGGEVQQNLEIIEKGRKNEWSLGLAGNFSDLLYVGATIGIQDLRYSYELNFTERDINNVHNSFNNDSTPLNTVLFNDFYRTRGSGFNARVGVIVRPLDWLRFGVSVVTPTWMNLSDTYETELQGQLDDDESLLGVADNGAGRFSYNFVTPYQVTTGLMVIIKRSGFLSADFEFTDYASARFSSDVSNTSPGFYDFANENQAINDLFDFAWNLRLGGELRLSPFRLRAGYARHGTVLKERYLSYPNYPDGEVSKLANSRQVFSGGFGIKQRNYYLDFAYVRDQSEDRRLLYTVQDSEQYSPELINQVASNLFLLTIGFTF